MGHSIPEYIRQQRLGGSAGNAASGDPAAALPYRELAKAGHAMTDMGLRAGEQIENAKYHDQYNRAKVTALRRFEEFDRSLDTNSDTESWEGGLGSAKKAIRDGGQFTNERARRDFETWLGGTELDWDRHVNSRKWQIDSRNYVESFNLAAKETSSRAIQAQSEQEYIKAVADGAELYGVEFEKDKDGYPVLEKAKLIDGWENKLLDSDEVRMAGFKGWRADTEAKRAKIVAIRNEDAAYAAAYSKGAKEGAKAARSPEFQAMYQIDAAAGHSIAGMLEERGRLEESERAAADAYTKKARAGHEDVSARNFRLRLAAGENVSADLVGALANAGDRYDDQKPTVTQQQYDELTKMVEAKAKPAAVETPDELQWSIPEAIREARMGKIPISQAEKMLRDNYGKLSESHRDQWTKELNGAYEDSVKPDDILKNPAVIGGFTTITSLKSAGGYVGTKPSQMSLIDKQDNEKAWRAVRSEFDRWVRVNKDKADQPDWDAMVEEKIESLTRPFAEKAALSKFVSFFRPAKYDRAKLAKMRKEKIKDAVGRGQIELELMAEIEALPESYKKVWRQAEKEGVTAEQFLEKMQSKLAGKTN